MPTFDSLPFFLVSFYHCSEVKRSLSVASRLTKPFTLLLHFWDDDYDLLFWRSAHRSLCSWYTSLDFSRRYFSTYALEKSRITWLTSNHEFIRKIKSICLQFLTPSQCRSPGSSPEWICQSDSSCYCGLSLRSQMPEGEREEDVVRWKCIHTWKNKRDYVLWIYITYRLVTDV